MAAAPNCWFLTGSQGLYGPETLQQVERQSQEIVNQLNGSGQLPLYVQWQPVLTDAEAIHRVMLKANADPTVGRYRVDARSRRRRCGSPVSTRCNAAAASAYSSQRDPAVGRDRYGFHEPEPGRPR